MQGWRKIKNDKKTILQKEKRKKREDSPEIKGDADMPFWWRARAAALTFRDGHACASYTKSSSTRGTLQGREENASLGYVLGNGTCEFVENPRTQRD